MWAMNHRFKLLALTIATLLALNDVLALRAFEAEAQAALPSCPEEAGVEYIFPSPRFSQDTTLFWIDSFGNTLWRSQDGGRSWLQMFRYTSDPVTVLIEQFEMVPHADDADLTLFLGVENWTHRSHHLFQSNDSGETWQERTPACSAGIYPDCPQFTLRAAGRTDVLFQPRLWFYNWSPLPFGIARSPDAGGTWDLIWEETEAWQVAVSPDYDYDQTLFATLIGRSATLNTSFLITSDGGQNWQAGGQGLCQQDFWHSDLQVSPGFPRDHTLLIGLYRNSLFKSEDSGQSWRAIFPTGQVPICDYSLTQLASLQPRFAPGYPDDPTIYLGANNGVYVSYDDGQHWLLLVESGTVFDIAISANPPSTPGSASIAEADGLANATAKNNELTTLHYTFLPQVSVHGVGLAIKPYALFVRAYLKGTHDAYTYRSDDGGGTWRCIEPPRVQKRAYLPVLLKVR